MSEGSVDVSEDAEFVSRGSSGSTSSCSDGTISAGTFAEAAVEGFTSCAAEGLCWMCVDCTRLASSDAIVVGTGRDGREVDAYYGWTSKFATCNCSSIPRNVRMARY